MTGDCVDGAVNEGADPGLRAVVIRPVDRREQSSRRYRLRHPRANNCDAMLCFDLCQRTIFDIDGRGIYRMDFNKWLTDVTGETRHKACPGHRMPLVAYASGVKQHRPVVICDGSIKHAGDGYKSGPAGRRCEPAIRENPISVPVDRRDRPLSRFEDVVSGLAHGR